MAFDCVLNAWRAHEKEIVDFLTRSGNRATAQDVLQDVFLKAMKQGAGFCTLENPRAWLFQVARTTLIDHARRSQPMSDLPDDVPSPVVDERPAVDELDTCIGRNLGRLSEPDRRILESCDLQGLTVLGFAAQEGMSLAAAKSRLLRARKRLRDALVEHCQVRFDDQGAVCCHTPNPTG